MDEVLILPNIASNKSKGLFEVQDFQLLYHDLKLQKYFHRDIQTSYEGIFSTEGKGMLQNSTESLSHPCSWNQSEGNEKYTFSPVGAFSKPEIEIIVEADVTKVKKIGREPVYASGRRLNYGKCLFCISIIKIRINIQLITGLLIQLLQI